MRNRFIFLGFMLVVAGVVAWRAWTAPPEPPSPWGEVIHLRARVEAMERRLDQVEGEQTELLLDRNLRGDR